MIETQVQICLCDSMVWDRVESILDHYDQFGQRFH